MLLMDEIPLITAEEIRKGLAKEGKSAGDLAEALGRSASVVSALLNGTRKVYKAGEARVIRDYLELHCKIRGLVAGTGQVLLYQNPNLSSTETPQDLRGVDSALQVQGAALGSDATADWMLYYDSAACGPVRNTDGKTLQLISISDDRIVVRKIAPASGGYRLFLATFPEITVQKIEWAVRLHLRELGADLTDPDHAEH